MGAMIIMIIACWVPQKDGNLHKAWEFSRRTTVEECAEMSATVAGAGPAGTFVVICGSPKDYP